MATVSVISMGEVLRIGRYANVLLGLIVGTVVYWSREVEWGEELSEEAEDRRAA